jgi:hypothetical protein
MHASSYSPEAGYALISDILAGIQQNLYNLTIFRLKGQATLPVAY